jgi:hypothetical protein
VAWHIMAWMDVGADVFYIYGFGMKAGGMKSISFPQLSIFAI